MSDYSMLILSGPSGCGKSTLSSFIQQNIPNLYLSISTTTRKIRANETNGVEYFFTTKEEFLKQVENGEFLEYEEVHGNLYGTSKKQIDKAILEKKFILLDVDVRGHNSIKKYYPNAKSIFIMTKNLKILEERLRNRALDDEEMIQKRLTNARDEIKLANNFDYLLINDKMGESKDMVLSISKSILCVNSLAKINSLLENCSI